MFNSLATFKWGNTPKKVSEKKQLITKKNMSIDGRETQIISHVSFYRVWMKLILSAPWKKNQTIWTHQKTHPYTPLSNQGSQIGCLGFGMT